MPDRAGSLGLLGVLDWVVVVAYAGGLMVLGLLMSRRRIAPVDYFLASRASHWPVIGLALIASNMSSTALVGLAGGVVGVAIDRLVLYRHYGADVITEGTGSGAARQLTRELGLSPAQQMQVDSIRSEEHTSELQSRP